MHASARSFVTRAAELFFAPPRRLLWTVSVKGRVIGLVAREDGRTRLSWFEPADPHLAGDAGPVPQELLDGEPEALAAVLSRSLGSQVELDSLSG